MGQGPDGQRVIGIFRGLLGDGLQDVGGLTVALAAFAAHQAQRVEQQVVGRRRQGCNGDVRRGQRLDRDDGDRHAGLGVAGQLTLQGPFVGLESGGERRRFGLAGASRGEIGLKLFGPGRIAQQIVGQQPALGVDHLQARRVHPGVQQRVQRDPLPPLQRRNPHGLRAAQLQGVVGLLGRAEIVGEAFLEPQRVGPAEILGHEMVGVFVLQDLARPIAVSRVPGGEGRAAARAGAIEPQRVQIGLDRLQVVALGHQIDVEPGGHGLLVHMHHPGQKPVIEFEVGGRLAKVGFLERAIDVEMLGLGLEPGVGRQGRPAGDQEQQDHQSAQDRLHVVPPNTIAPIPAFPYLRLRWGASTRQPIF